MQKHSKVRALVFTEDIVDDFAKHRRELPKILKKIMEADLKLIFITDDIGSFCREKLKGIGLRLKNPSLISLGTNGGAKKENGSSLADWAQILKMSDARPSEIVLFSSSPADFSPARNIGINFILVSRDKKNVSGGYPLLNSLIAMTAL